MAHNAYLVAEAGAEAGAEPVEQDAEAADFTRVRLEVHVNWQTVQVQNHGQEGHETTFWHRPLECSVTRRDYRHNRDVLFTLLNKALPYAEWARQR
jgi:hypothetical protein